MPNGDGWIHELKHDGFRILAFKDGDTVRLWSRNGRDWSREFVAISEALRQELLEDHVRVTAIEPSVVETELQSHLTDEEVRETLDAMRKRLDALQAEDIGNAIVYAVTQPARVSVNEILIRPTRQP